MNAALAAKGPSTKTGPSAPSARSRSAAAPAAVRDASVSGTPRARSSSKRRPPMNGAEGTGVPSKATLTSMSIPGAGGGTGAPTAIATIQVPVERTPQGAPR